MWHTFGHDSIKQLLDQQLSAGRFPHAYLFAGPGGVGKKTLALELAGRLLDIDNPISHPDLIMRDLQEDPSVEAVRELIIILANKPFRSNYKIAILNNFDNASPASANALLKTLEEPSLSTIIILISATANLLPTVVSRCQVMHFNRLSASQMRQFADKANFGGLAKQFLPISNGCPGNLHQLLREPEASADLLQQIENLDGFPSTTLAERILTVQQLAEMDSDELQRLFSYWLCFRRAKLAEDTGGFQILGRLREAISSLSSTANKKLVLQRLLLS